MYGLEGRVAIVTGAGRHGGLGEGIARRLGQEGCLLVLADLGRIQGDLFPEHGVATTEEMQEVASENTTGHRDGGGDSCLRCPLRAGG